MTELVVKHQHPLCLCEISWLILFHLVTRFFNQNSGRGPLAHFALVCKDWSAVSKSKYVSTFLESMDRTALWKLNRLNALSANHIPLIEASSKLISAKQYMKFLAVASPEVINHLYRASVRSFGKQKASLIDLTVQKIVRQCGLDALPNFYEALRPWVPNFIQPDPTLPIRLSVPRDLYHALKFYIFEEHSKEVGLLGKFPKDLIIKLLILEERFKPTSVHEKVLLTLCKDLRWAFSCKSFSRLQLYREVLGGILDSTDVLILVKVLTPISFFATLAECQAFFEFFGDLVRPVNITAINSLSCEFSSFVVSLNPRNIDSWNLNALFPWIPRIKSWRFDLHLIIQNTGSLASMYEGKQKQLFESLQRSVTELLED